MKRDFFQKNIFTIGIVVVFIAILFTIINPFNSKQSSNKESLNKLKKEIGQLKQENENLNKKLETEKSFYTDKIKQLDQPLIALATATGDAQYQNLIEYLQKGIKNELVDSLGIFSPEYTKRGDKIAGLTVSDVTKESQNGSKGYNVNFTGELTVKGSIMRSEGRGYIFIVEENLEKLPHTLPEYSTVFIKIKNENDLIKMLGDEKAQKMTLNGKSEFVGVLKNYSCDYVLGNSAEFVRMISQN